MFRVDINIIKGSCMIMRYIITKIILANHLKEKPQLNSHSWQHSHRYLYIFNLFNAEKQNYFILTNDLTIDILMCKLQERALSYFRWKF